MSLREQMEQHRSNAICATCHSRMDPIGFGLENFDAIGQWRTEDGKFPIDPSGTLTNGKTFKGPEELTQVLAAQPAAFSGAITEKMLTYALGRGLEPYDRPTIKGIVNNLAQNDYRFSSLVLGIVKSLPFQERSARPVRAEESTPSKPARVLAKTGDRASNVSHP
jgi:hypothetical protein